ncbi:MAG: class I SAM-dependent methyltransferase [Thaumarchaeota archaeon]|nr:class I SAM-dependent methyltransferase [Nitrososphaerota archaeon]
MDPEKACLVNCELFGKHSEYFESKIVPLWQDLYDSLAARSGVEPGWSVLDIGTGTGEIALRMSKLVGPEGHVLAVDLQKEMLSIAEGKKNRAGAGNLEFRRMALEELDLAGSAFDAVIGNYSLCCVMDYGAALAECFRVLKPGGRLIYNHGGPNDPLVSELAFKMFEKYQTKEPSKQLADLRESDAAQAEGFEKYRDPLVTLRLLRNLGYHQAEATIAQREIDYGSAEDYVDRMLAFDRRSEAEEVEESDLARFRFEAISALRSVSEGPGFQIADEVVYYTAIKPS